MKTGAMASVSATVDQSRQKWDCYSCWYSSSVHCTRYYTCESKVIHPDQSVIFSEKADGPRWDSNRQHTAF